MTPRPPRSTRTDSLCPYTALVRSTGTACEARAGDPAQPAHADDAGRRTGRGDRAGDLVGVPAAEGAGRRGAGRPERRAGDARRGPAALAERLPTDARTAAAKGRRGVASPRGVRREADATGPEDGRASVRETVCQDG